MENGFEPGMSNFRHEDVSPLDLGLGHFGSSVRCVAQNKMFNSTASSAGFAWGITFAPNATSVMMITGGEENFFHCKRCGIQNPNRMLLFNLVEGFTQLCGKSNGSQLPCLL
ncbi:uncharacterized protein LOC110646705 isoform X2 [Hevea brasiliensis]|uniref:uncharacterized protein LOC110646705 isoform X2 n=1 Tax=Hevea brasiliensis TaxID=3981 RepID=UPI0025FAB8FB|nr:uncharacterized protein LOC110646705 isoform X2 [Hevea brasiliensis]